MDEIENMEVGAWNLETEEWGDENDPTSDWSLANTHATFSHKDSCEFIFWLGKGEMHIERLKDLKELGFSSEFVERCKYASEQGFNYINFYS